MPTHLFLPSRCAVPENDDVRQEYRSSQPRLKKQLSAVLPAHGRPTMTMVFVTCASTHQSCAGEATRHDGHVRSTSSGRHRVRTVIA